ncbi:PIN domain-containing protein [Halobaculum sp. WSA2]|uniref:PIN domain-containing protein n=1 Tax=Halobaculum saliterrae TaxID=2073113 RepID=A0A6B0SV65_9EURY|nr:PIN domain-containing protein [Halobaculum saliterrae]MXR40503.1 PIN domain-containing protein [Halobaculum saliterrae]
MYVESDFLFALAKPSDWLKADAEAALDEYDVHTSIATYVEFLVYFYDEKDAEYTLPVTQVIPNLLELIPVQPDEHEDALLAATAFIDEEELTPFDAVHAGIAHVEGESVLSTDRAYDSVGVERIPLDEVAEE